MLYDQLEGMYCMYVLYVIRQGQFIHALKVLQRVQTSSLQEDTRICNWFYSTKAQDSAAVLLLLLRMRMRCGLVCGKSVKTQDGCTDGPARSGGVDE